MPLRQIKEPGSRLPQHAAMTSTIPLEARPAPRFTSYPTALHFSREVGPEQHRLWLSQLERRQSLSLYVHVPFCQELCLYCGCQTAVARSYRPVAGYVELLGQELDLILGSMREPPYVGHLHFGGGTPTMLRPSDFCGFVARLRGAFDFRQDAEIAVEIDPRAMSPVQVEMLAQVGVTRASLGIQSFDLMVQQAVRRLQSFELTQRLTHWLRFAGIAALNFDLMYGLPHQTVENVVGSTRQALSLDPDRIALFGYAHVPWMKRHQALLPEAALPDSSARREQFEAAAECIEAAGYVRIGFDHFAKPDDEMAAMAATGQLRRNFQGYTTDRSDALIGMGASAISSFAEGFAQNHASVPDYREALVRGRLPTARGVRATPADRLRAAIIERLMCDLAVDLDELCQMHHLDASTLAQDMERLAPLVAAGLAVREGQRVRVAREARHLIRIVSAAFDARSGGQQRYSSAI